ncbi:MAG: CaiB/BaiF CoA transferase family protein [Woeseiaceae bacterium]
MVDSNPAKSQGPLRGVKVLDLSRILAGPWATQLLGDYGAEIIKVERPGAGDDTRSWGPPWLESGDGEAERNAAYFLSANRNKRSMTVDISHPDGIEIIRQLVLASDVFVENFKVGTLARYGLDYANLKTQNPALIYCSVSAYGQSGSRSDQPGYDAMIQASGGLMSITGAPDDEGGSPQKVGVAIADIMAGMYAVSAILAALIARNEIGTGQQIDIPLYDSQVAWLANQNMNYLIGDVVPERQGTGHPNLVPYQTFATADGYLTLAVGNDRQFVDCARCLDLPEVGVDPRFRTNADRVQHREALIPMLATKLGEKSTNHWLESLTGCGVPVGPINSIADVLENDYAQERGLVRKMQHRSAGGIPTVANPVEFSASTIEYEHAPPFLGEHTDEILTRELGYTDEKIAALREVGAI